MQGWQKIKSHDVIFFPKTPKNGIPDTAPQNFENQKFQFAQKKKTVFCVLPKMQKSAKKTKKKIFYGFFEKKINFVKNEIF